MAFSSQMAKAVRSKGDALRAGDPARAAAAQHRIGVIKLTEFVERTVAGMEPLTDEEVAQVAALLRPTAEAS